jgi:hypothetical protein
MAKINDATPWLSSHERANVASALMDVGHRNLPGGRM